MVGTGCRSLRNESIHVKEAKRAEEKLELVHADICGPMKTDSYAGKAFGFFKKFKALAKNQSYRKLKVLRTDRGGEFLSKEFSGFSNEHGIKRELTQRAYKLFDQVKNTIIISRDVQFNEQEVWDKNMMGLGSSVNLEVQKEGIIEEQPNTTCSLESNVTPSGISQVNTRGEGLQSRRSKRGNVPKRHFEVEGKSFDFAMFAGDPANAESTTTTITLVSLPDGKKAIGLGWIFKTKLHSDGTIQRHKARLVARGYVQEQGINFVETFSPVARFETVRIILALAAMMRWMVFQFDVKSAFLNGELKEEVYVQQPEFF
ncbi:retrovirus-related pol polyprotein from transposon TNT 1-94 [Tanacetum coccineum]